MASGFVAVPDWFLHENAGAGVAVADIDGDGKPDIVVLTVDDPPEKNLGMYRVGHGLNPDGTVSGWSPWHEVPNWDFHLNADVGVAVSDVDGDGQLDLVVFLVDTPAGQNAAYYRVGHSLAGDGTVTGGWGPWLAVPDWFPFENQGGDITIADINGSGRPDLVVLMVDAPAGQNAAYYRVGHDLAADGTVTGGWGPWLPVPDWRFWENQGAGIAVADLDGNGSPEVLVFTVDNPVGQNGGYYTVGWNLDATGRARDGWSAWSAVDDWLFFENQGGSATFADLNGTGRAELVILTVDNPVDRNTGYYRVLDLVTDLDTAPTKGVWRLLDFDTQINPIHAALLHTGDVLLFSGSGNDIDDFIAHQFRSRVWHYPSTRFDAPETPIDLFCCGHAFLPDGRLLAAGGTEQYDPFHGLRDAVVFDPASLSWKHAPDMAGGRWYPSLLTLADGRVLAISGLGADGPLNEVPELYNDTPPNWSPVHSPGPWPMYSHVFLLRDSRVFYSGGQYGPTNGVPPTVWNLDSGATTPVPELLEPEQRNQSASVLLPPAQEQRVMIMGGGGATDHHGGMVAGVKDVRIVDLTAATPTYEHAAAMHHERMHLCAVLLPDRTVFVSGGSALEENAAVAALEAEIFNPATQAWTLAATARLPRLYHSIALLMPDGKVVTAGSNPVRKDEELRIEVYWPPYLFRGPQPTLALSATQGSYGGTLRAITDAPALASVNLIRSGSTTHSANNEQRLVDLSFTTEANGTLTLQLPTEPTLAPPGWYLVFAVNTEGVPSPGVWLQLT
ncbi:MAG: galactose oxidase-like domain-containing protein [Pseudonocardiaceae bacterium]